MKLLLMSALLALLTTSYANDQLDISKAQELQMIRLVEEISLEQGKEITIEESSLSYSLSPLNLFVDAVGVLAGTSVKNLEFVYTDKTGEKKEGLARAIINPESGKVWSQRDRCYNYEFTLVRLEDKTIERVAGNRILNKSLNKKQVCPDETQQNVSAKNLGGSRNPGKIYKANVSNINVETDHTKVIKD